MRFGLLVLCPRKRVDEMISSFLLTRMSFDHVFSSKEPASSTLLKHLGTHEYIGDPLVDWTPKGAVMPAKNQEQFDL